MGPKTKRLCERLRETAHLLRHVNESHWAEWMETSLSRIEAADLAGVEHLLGAFGGMGSFNDLVLAAANGHAVNRDNHRDCNRRLAALRTELHTLATDVNRDPDIDE